MAESEPGSQANQTRNKSRAAGSQDALDSISVAAFEVDGRIFRTLWHSFTQPNAIARAALEADYQAYLSPVRVFVALFSFQFAIAALFGVPLESSLESLTVYVDPSSVTAWLQTGHRTDLTAADIDPALADWSAVMLWPITIVSSLPYLVLLKLYRRSLSWWGHVLLYLVPVNGSFVILLVFLPLYPLVPHEDLRMVLFALSTLLGMILYFVLAARVIARFYARTATGVALRIVGLLAVFPITITITILLQYFLTAALLQYEFGLRIDELLLTEFTNGVGQ